ncbi:MAG TPA: ParB N-terminal domain-containing protein [Methanothermobacter sp.]|nr:ParB N-terminal domain-containing protein [Methanothermobacter sp.]
MEYIKTGELIPYVNNPRNNENAIDVVAGSIKEFGFKNPIIIDKDNVIIAGHTRLLASRKLGLEEVPVIRAEDLTEQQVKAFRIADNKTSEFADWDNELLGIELEELGDLFTGFSEEELENLFNDSNEEVVEDDFEVELPDEPKSKFGDIYQLGRHRVMCGDSTKIDDVQKLMDGVRVDLLLTDPPYNVNYTGGTKDQLTIQNDNLGDSEFRQFLVDALSCADSVMKPGAVFYIWHADSEGYNFRGACHDIDWEVRQCLIWNKSSMVMGRQDYHWKHEPCLYGWKSGGSHLWASDRKQTTVLEFERPSRNKEHPTMKPIKLFDYQIQNNTKKEDVVLDLFGGSGTTLVASEQNGRISYTMEFDPKYVDVIINRWEQLTGNKAELIEGEENV